MKYETIVDTLVDVLTRVDFVSEPVVTTNIKVIVENHLINQLLIMPKYETLMATDMKTVIFYGNLVIQQVGNSIFT